MSTAERQALLRHADQYPPVYPIIHMVRADMVHFIDTPLSYDALTAPDLTYTLIRPLLEKYVNIQRGGNLSMVFCLLLNRVYFIRDRSFATAAVSQTRAELCEILAMRVLSENGNDLYHLAHCLTDSFPVFNGADESVINAAREEREDDFEERVGNAIELAILGKAKRFIKSSSCQKIIDGIWRGKCVYQAQSSHSILSDTYKHTPIHFYDPHKAPLLDHYRLKVPAIRSVLEYINFLIFFLLFFLALETAELDYINIYEAAYMIYALGFSLEKIAAMQEHGIRVYFKGTWNGFDLALVTTYTAYVTIRIYGIAHTGSPWARRLGIDLLALTACLLFPRLAFVTLRNNLMVLSLRAMLLQFAALMLIAAFCFTGFLYALWTLSRTASGFSLSTIGWWMLDIWFGLDATGFQRSGDFHPIFGPVLMVTYACLSNTLLLTVLVSILSNTFAKINEDAAAEAMFRRAVSTIEGVKADSLFSYQPPINVVALIVMLPASYILSPRWFHKVNVFLIRLTSFPILLLIALYERQSKKSGNQGFYHLVSTLGEKAVDALPRPVRRLLTFDRLAGSDADIDAVFEIEEELALNSSALDMADDIGSNRIDIERPRRRSSANTHRSNGRPVVSSGQHSPNSHPIPRARVNSMMNRGMHMAENISQSFTSPLAQIFQPLIVDDDLIEEEQDPARSLPDSRNPQYYVSSTPPQPQHLLSYGPASRRRLSSVNRRGANEPPPARRFPLMDNPVSESPHSDLSLQVPQLQEEEIPTAEKILEGEAVNGSSAHWSLKMELMERRQARMEQLLQQLVDGLPAR